MAQVPGEWVGPASQFGAAAIIATFMRWLMLRLTVKIEALERAMYFNTRATLLAGIAQEEATAAVKAKLSDAKQELEALERELERSRQKRDDV